MKRYWLSVPVMARAEGFSGYPPTKEDEQFDKEILNLGFEYASDGGSFVYKTYNEEEIPDIEAKFEELLKKYGFSTDDRFLNVAVQPQCPKCEKLGRFAESFCSECGTELVQ